MAKYSTKPGTTSHCKLDAHADASVAGLTFLLIQFMREKWGTSMHTNKYEPKTFQLHSPWIWRNVSCFPSTKFFCNYQSKQSWKCWIQGLQLSSMFSFSQLHWYSSIEIMSKMLGTRPPIVKLTTINWSKLQAETLWKSNINLGKQGSIWKQAPNVEIYVGK